MCGYWRLELFFFFSAPSDLRSVFFHYWESLIKQWSCKNFRPSWYWLAWNSHIRLKRTELNHRIFKETIFRQTLRTYFALTSTIRDCEIHKLFHVQSLNQSKRSRVPTIDNAPFYILNLTWKPALNYEYTPIEMH